MAAEFKMAATQISLPQSIKSIFFFFFVNLLKFHLIVFSVNSFFVLKITKWWIYSKWWRFGQNF
jgi:hypothetical protein